MESVILGLVLAGMFVFGYFVVDSLGRFLDKGRRDQTHRPSGKMSTAARKVFFTDRLTAR